MKKMKKTPKLVIFSMWLLNNYIENEPDIHKAAKAISDTSAYNKLSRLARTVEEAEAIKRQRENKSRSQRHRMKNKSSLNDEWFNDSQTVTSATIYSQSNSDYVPDGEPIKSDSIEDTFKEVYGYDIV